MKLLWVWLMVVLFALLGCEKKENPAAFSQADTKKQGLLEKQTSYSGYDDSRINEPSLQNNLFHPFYIFMDKGFSQNHYIPSGFMPNGNCISLDDTWRENCQAGKTCMKITFDVECSRQNQKWAGIYWLNPPNNWGKKKGGYNLTGAEKLTFWARGEKGGEKIQEFTVGGITGDFSDSDTAAIGPVILSREWRKYTIDLRGKDLTYISGGFAWSTSEEANPDACMFYLDEIKFE